MSNSKIIDEIKGVICTGDEPIDVYATIEQLKAVATSTLSYIEFSRNDQMIITNLVAILRLIGEITDSIENKVNIMTTRIIDIANTAVTD